MTLNSNPSSLSKSKMGEDYTEEIRRFLEKIFAVINSPMSEFDKDEQIKKILKGNVKLLGIFLAKTRARNITTRGFFFNGGC